MKLQDLAHFPTEIPMASFLPIGFPISFVRRDDKAVEIYVVIESGIEISSNIEYQPNTMFRVQKLDTDEQYYCFTAPLEELGPTGMMGFACLVSRESLDQVWEGNTLVFPREDIIATLLRIIDLRTALCNAGVDNQLLCQRLWPLAIENTRWHVIHTGLAQYTLQAMRVDIVTDGSFAIERDHIGEGCWIVLSNYTYMYVKKPTALFMVTQDIDSDTLFDLIRQYPAV